MSKTGISYMQEKRKDCCCLDHSQVFSLSVCKFEVCSVIREVIEKTMTIYIDAMDFDKVDENEIYIHFHNNEVITYKKWKEILESIVLAMQVDTGESAYRTKKQWQQAMEAYDTGMLNFATYLDCMWI